jgi:hypothetical protein
MAGSKDKAPKQLPVDGIYAYFKLLEKAGTIGKFIEECKKKKLTLGVTKELFDLGHDHFQQLQKLPHASAVGPGSDCPACPKPPGAHG